MNDGYRWAGKYTANTSPRMARYRIDPDELAAWTARNQHIADELARHPFITEPRCEECQRMSRRTPCWYCAEETL